MQSFSLLILQTLFFPLHFPLFCVSHTCVKTVSELFKVFKQHDLLKCAQIVSDGSHASHQHQIHHTLDAA